MAGKTDYDKFRDWLDTTDDEQYALNAEDWSDPQKEFIRKYFEEQRPQDREDREDEGDL